jgi:predicted secreted protein
MVELAMSTQPTCAVDQGSLLWSFNKCFAPKETLDDPQLEATFSVLRREYAAVELPRLLGEARVALRQPSLALGSQAWKDARAAVMRVKEANDYRRVRMDRLFQLARGAPNASDADRYKMQQTLRAWSDFLAGQERNYSDLLRQLAFVGE